jgi:hypothetical protein
MKDLDPKSLIIGFLTAVLVTVAMGNALADKPVGKYQIYGFNTDLYLLDTTTGKFWYKKNSPIQSRGWGAIPSKFYD